MSDIVSRLRKWATPIEGIHDALDGEMMLLSDAADEIERLTGERNSLLVLLSTKDREIEKLRKLVKEAYCEGFQEGKDGGWGVPWNDSDARAALEEGRT